MEEETKVQNSTVLTEVVSVASEEKRTGKSIPVPNAEELAARANASFIKHKTMFSNAFDNLSARGKNRVMKAVLDLPSEGIPNLLNGDEEKIAFLYGQKLLNDRFLITQHYIYEEYKKAKAKEQQSSVNNEVKND